MKKRLLCLIGIVFAAACFTGCQQKDPEPGDIAGYDEGEEYLSIWVHSIEDTEEGQAYKESVESFNEAYDGQYFADIEFVPRNDSGGGYSDKVNASVMAGGLPDVLTVDGPNISAYAANGIIQPLAELTEEEESEYLPSIIEQGTVNDELYALGVMESSVGFYYNKDMFREAGLDPEKAPQTWEELAEYAAILTTDDRYGVEIPIDQWLLSIFILQNGGEINNIEGTETYLDTPEAIGAVEYLLDLVNKGYMPAKRLFGDSSSDFVAGKTAMMYNSTGSLAFVRDSASFDWGVGFLPAGKERIIATGGGQFVICSGISEERQAAAWDFIKWMTEPAQTAKWSMASGFIAVNPAAFDLPEMTEYTAALPQAIVARDQLQYAVGEPPKTHDAREVSQAMASMFENMLAGNISPEEGMQELQASCDSILAEYN